MGTGKYEARTHTREMEEQQRPNRLAGAAFVLGGASSVGWEAVIGWRRNRSHKSIDYITKVLQICQRGAEGDCEVNASAPSNWRPRFPEERISEATTCLSHSPVLPYRHKSPMLSRGVQGVSNMAPSFQLRLSALTCDWAQVKRAGRLGAACL